VFHCFAPRCYSADIDVAIAIAIAIAVGTQNGTIATEVTVAVAVETAVEIKTTEVETPDNGITTGDGIKVRVDQFDGFAYDVFHCFAPVVTQPSISMLPLLLPLPLPLLLQTA
jgi:hypothetical protein